MSFPKLRLPVSRIFWCHWAVHWQLTKPLLEILLGLFLPNNNSLDSCCIALEARDKGLNIRSVVREVGENRDSWYSFKVYSHCLHYRRGGSLVYSSRCNLSLFRSSCSERSLYWNFHCEWNIWASWKEFKQTINKVYEHFIRKENYELFRVAVKGWNQNSLSRT